MSAVATPFPRRPIPVPGESIYGFERRFAACTRYDSLGAFRQSTGLFEVVPGSLQKKFASLATLAGLGPADLDFMRWTGRDGIRRGCSAILLGHLTLALCRSRSMHWISTRYLPLFRKSACSPRCRLKRIHRQD